MKTVYLLIAITAGGNVSNTEFSTIAACKDAESLARYGETVSEYEARSAKVETYRKKISDEFYEKHKPRDPRSEYEVNYVKALKEAGARSSGRSSWSCTGEIGGMSVTADWKIQDHPCGIGGGLVIGLQDGEWIDYVHGDMVKRRGGDIKTTRCLEETR